MAAVLCSGTRRANWDQSIHSWKGRREPSCVCFVFVCGKWIDGLWKGYIGSGVFVRACVPRYPPKPFQNTRYIRTRLQDDGDGVHRQELQEAVGGDGVAPGGEAEGGVHQVGCVCWCVIFKEEEGGGVSRGVAAALCGLRVCGGV